MNKDFGQTFFEGGNPAGYENYGEIHYPGGHPMYLYRRVFQQGLLNCKVLVVGCAYGIGVLWLLRKGFDAYGLDISEFAISQANEEVKDRLILGDVLATDVSGYDAIITEDMMCCLTDEEAVACNNKLVAAAPKVIHIMEYAPSMAPYYNLKTLDDWGAFIQHDNVIWMSKR